MSNALTIRLEQSDRLLLQLDEVRAAEQGRCCGVRCIHGLHLYVICVWFVRKGFMHGLYTPLP